MRRPYAKHSVRRQIRPDWIPASAGMTDSRNALQKPIDSTPIRSP